MRVFKTEANLIVEGWNCSKDVYRVVDAGADCFLTHEDQIPETWPEEAREHIRREIRDHRELAENEDRFPTGGLCALAVDRDELVLSCGANIGMQYCRDELARRAKTDDPWKQFWQRCLDYYNRHAPLAENETVSTSGKRGVMSIETEPTRYSSPRLCVLWSDESMSFYCRSHLDQQGGDWARRKAFYEANRPLADDEITVNGKVCKVTLSNDGAVAKCEGNCDPWYGDSLMTGRNGWCNSFVSWSSEEERLAAYDKLKLYWEANRPQAQKTKKWSVGEWLDTGLWLSGQSCHPPKLLRHERDIEGFPDCPAEIRDLARKRIIANRPIEAHEFRPDDAPETIGVFGIDGEIVTGTDPSGAWSVTDFKYVFCGAAKYLPKYIVRAHAWCREQPQYKAWLKEWRKTHSELGDDGVLRFVDADGKTVEVRAACSVAFTWRRECHGGGFASWYTSNLSVASEPGTAFRHHADAIRKLCADWEKANRVEDVTIRTTWPDSQWVCPIVPPSKFQGRKFTVTFSDAGPIGGAE